MAYRFTTPSSEAHWLAYHDIRRIVLFENRGRFGVYDPNHLDEFKANNFPKLLIFDRRPIGVIRIDILKDVAWFRRVAISEGCQRMGHGRVLLDLSEKFARDHKTKRVESSVASDAIQFYLRCGYNIREAPHDAASVLMFKDLVN
jgi:GNAT superfamily N-acetyltransferase